MEDILKQILSEIMELKEGQNRFEGKLTQFEERQKAFEERQIAFEERQTEFGEGLTRLEIQVSENTQILKALEHSVQVSKAEHDKMLYEVSETRGEVKGIRRDLNAVEIITSKNWNEITQLKLAK